MPVNKIEVQGLADGPFEVGKLYKKANGEVFIVSEVLIPTEDPIDFEKTYFCLVSLSTGKSITKHEDLYDLENEVLYIENFEYLRGRVSILQD